MEKQRPDIYIDAEGKNFKPFDGLVLVKLDDVVKEEISEGGIIMPVERSIMVDSRSTSGTIFRRGDGVELAEGTRVVFMKTDGVDAKFRDDIYTIIKYKSLLGTIDES